MLSIHQKNKHAKLRRHQHILTDSPCYTNISCCFLAGHCGLYTLLYFTSSHSNFMEADATALRISKHRKLRPREVKRCTQRESGASPGYTGSRQAFLTLAAHSSHLQLYPTPRSCPRQMTFESLVCGLNISTSGIPQVVLVKRLTTGPLSVPWAAPPGFWASSWGARGPRA